MSVIARFNRFDIMNDHPRNQVVMRLELCFDAHEVHDGYGEVMCLMRHIQNAGYVEMSASKGRKPIAHPALPRKLDRDNPFYEMLYPGAEYANEEAERFEEPRKKKKKATKPTNSDNPIVGSW